MKSTCDFFGMFQAVREPTRNEYLLDLVLSNIQGISVKVMPYIADHKGLLCRLPFREILENSVVREVWDFNSAEWKELRLALDAFDWGGLSKGTAEDALTFFHEVLWQHLVKFIPRRKIVEVKSSHPWLNERTKRAISKKNDAEGSPAYQARCEKCAQILKEERNKYMCHLKAK